MTWDPNPAELPGDDWVDMWDRLNLNEDDYNTIAAYVDELARQGYAIDKQP